MRIRLTTPFLIVMVAIAGCGGDKPLDHYDSPAGGDSLIALADEPMLPDTTPPAAVVTEPVERPAPAPSRPRPTPAPAPPPAPAPAATAPMLEAGTAITTTVMDSVHSQHNAVGDLIRLRVNADYTDGRGRVVIPAGSVVTMAITAIAPAANRGGAGTLELAARSVAVNGESVPISARSTDFEYELRARGIGAGEVAKTGAGAVVGGILGRVIGGKKGTIVGAIDGAAAGAAVASSTIDRDIVLSPGKAMTITLDEEFSRD